MELKFEQLDYQTDAVNAVVRLFEGQPNRRELFSLQNAGMERFVGNTLNLAEEQISKNLKQVQATFGLPETEMDEHGLNFSVEMETGTGKTYVYLRTVFELNRQYGWTKFVIVVPSVAIREGVLQTLRATKTHFAELFGKPVVKFTEYDSKRLGALRNFAVSGGIEIMVINIQSFEKELNVINQINESGDAPIELIRQTCPIVIVDEPQNMETENRLAALDSFNPLFVLRYSATHKNSRHKVYSLNPVEAYNKKLVKQIVVQSVLADENGNGAFVELMEVYSATKGRLKAKIRLHFQGKKNITKKIVTVQHGDDLFDKSGSNETYRHGYIVDGLDFAEQAIALSNGRTISRSDNQDALQDEIMKAQIRCTVEEHLKREKKLKPLGIKVLSLFFIDRVEHYCQADGSAGKFSQWFAEIYRELTGEDAKDVHDGYFSRDKNGNFQNTQENKQNQADYDAYHLIMCDKETLLSFASPLRFIFSHSALKEGWDNPNVFTICTLNETSSEMKKRQEIGRGLRLPVDINGERVHDQNTNVLTVVANESYADFSRKLQTEIEQETGISFSGRIKNRDDRRRVRLTKSLALSGDFKELWERIKHKTVYHVAFDTGELVRRAAEQLALVEPIRPQIVDTRVRIEQLGAERGFMVNETPGAGIAADVQRVHVPDILSVLEKRTGLTRAAIFAVLDKADAFGKLARNPQQMIDEAARAINRAKQEVMVDGISYQKTGESYDMCLFENHELEAYLYDAAMKSGAIAVDNPDKTIYDYVTVDSEVEYKFMKALEQAGNIRFYVKLPGWFTIPTPLGSYNPDWAVVFDGDERVYFVAETKGLNDINDTHLSASERGKILAARQHFVEVEVEYVAPVRDLQSALKKCDMKERKW